MEFRVDGLSLKLLQCGTCGVWHAIPNTQYNTAKNEGGFWTCPNGHSRGFHKGSLYNQVESLKQERDRYKQQIARVSDEYLMMERKLTAQKGVTTRLKNRVSKGVCPCCNRTFTNLARHMNSKHPGYLNESA